MLRTKFSPDTYFVPPFENIILREDGSFEYFLSPKLALVFDNLIMMSKDGSMHTDLIEVIVKLGTFEHAKNTLKTKFNLFRDHEEDRLSRFFSNQSKYIFFDSEQSYQLTELFNTVHMMVDVKVEYNYKEVNLSKLRVSDRYRVIEAMNRLDIISELNPSEFRDYSGVRKFKKLTTRTEISKRGGAKLMTKQQLIMKIAGGATMLAIGGVTTIAGFIVANKSIGALLGIEKEVILVEDDYTEEAEA